MPDASKPDLKSTLDLFSSITVQGLFDSQLAVLERSVTFPAQLGSYLENYVPHSTMQPHSLPIHGRNLQLRLGKLIGTGRFSHVYEVQVLGISNGAAGGSHFDLEIPNLCIKLAEPDKPRSLAREAWFYEQLDLMGLQGVVVPHNFGLFTAHCSLEHVIPWRTNDWFFRKDGREESIFAREADQQYDAQCCEPEDDESLQDDSHGSNHNSYWKSFHQDPGSPVISLMLLERLGDTLVPDRTKGRFCSKDDEKDLKDILDDIAWNGFEHLDLRRTQFVRSISPAPCTRHGRAHKWHLLDFQWVVRTSATEDDRKIITRSMKKDLSDHYFWCLFYSD